MGIFSKFFLKCESDVYVYVQMSVCYLFVFREMYDLLLMLFMGLIVVVFKTTTVLAHCWVYKQPVLQDLVLAL